MEKTFFNNSVRYIFYLSVFVYVYSPCKLLADHECNCEFCGLEVDFEEPVNYEELGEYEDMFRTFEEKIEEENELGVECGVFKKWGKKVKRWFKKRTVRLIKKCINLKKIRNSEDCAYTVAKFKRKVDKIHETGSIESMLEDFDEHIPDDPHIASFDKFKHRIKYYYHNKHARPPTNKSVNFLGLGVECRKPEYNGELDHIPTRALVGGVEIACGSLIAVIPIPGCRWLGGALISHGASQIYEGFMQKYEEDQKSIL